jgi:predicted GNAT family acetyltransferase
MTPAPNVTNNAAAGQFEIHTEAGIALLKYALRGDTLDLIHTEVPRQFEGRGYGAALVKTALEYARAEQMKVIATCPFVKKFIVRHNEYADLVKRD